jgi:tetratricopeptide (TPR) repeat protein
MGRASRQKKPRKKKEKAKASKPSFDAAALRATLDRIAALRPEGDWTTGEAWTEDEIAAFEQKHGLTLPPEYRAYLRDFGDGGPGFVRITPLEGRPETELERASKPFRVTTSARIFPLRDAALSGTIELGPTDAHVMAYLVVTGSRAGEVWVDGTPADGTFAREGTFGELMMQWIDAALAEANEDRAILSVAALGDQGAARVAGEANTRGLAPIAVARQILAEERIAAEPNPAACEAAAAIFETAGEPGLGTLCFALAGQWPHVRRVAESALADAEKHMKDAKRPGDSGAFAIDVATHLTHLALAFAALGERSALPCAFPEQSRYDLVDTQTVPRIVGRLSDEAQRQFFGSVDPSIALSLFTRSEMSTWAPRIASIASAVQKLAPELAAGRANVPDAAEATSALIESLQTATGDGETLGPVLDGLARCSAVLGNAKEAGSCWLRCRALGWHLPDGDPPLAELMRNERDVVLKLSIAAALIGAEKYADAADLCTQTITAGAGEWTFLAHYNRGTARAAQGDHKRAIEDFNRTIELKPDSAWAFNNRANAYYHLGDLQRAKESSRKSIKLDPKNAPAYWVAANICAAENDRMGFCENIEKAMRLGAKVWERLDKIHPRFAKDHELEALVAKYRS